MQPEPSAALSLSERRYQELVELSPDGIIVHDGAHIVLVNKAVLRLAGATARADVIGRPIEQFLDPPYLKAVESEIAGQLFSSQPAPPVQDMFTRLDGSRIPVEVRAQLISDAGRPAVHLVVRDISERIEAEIAARNLENRLQHAQRMEAIGLIAGGVAHEVNNMMTIVLGYAELLSAFNVPRQRDDILSIESAAQRAADVSKQLLAFSRQGRRNAVVLDLGTAAMVAEPLLRILVGKNRVLEIVGGDQISALFDAGQFEQVLLNLVSNAHDATPDGGRILVSISEQSNPRGIVTAQGTPLPDGQYAVIRVRDNGTGITPDVQRRMFDPFFSTKPTGKGTGLGLSAVYGILKQNHAFIAVHTAEGSGTEIAIYVPLYGRRGTVEPADAHAAASLQLSSRRTVLVVDDERSIRMLAARALDLAGYEVSTAGSADEALALIALNGAPQLLLTDISMPGIDDVEFATRVRKTHPGLPIIFMTGNSAAAVHDRVAVLGRAHTFDKPFSVQQLVQYVNEVCNTDGR